MPRPPKRQACGTVLVCLSFFSRRPGRLQLPEVVLLPLPPQVAPTSPARRRFSLTEITLGGSFTTRWGWGVMGEGVGKKRSGVGEGVGGVDEWGPVVHTAELLQPSGGVVGAMQSIKHAAGGGTRRWTPAVLMERKLRQWPVRVCVWRGGAPVCFL